jgi:hypothetical protein
MTFAVTQHSSISKPIFPIFQRSTIPIGTKPLTWQPDWRRGVEVVNPNVILLNVLTI